MEVAELPAKVRRRRAKSKTEDKILTTITTLTSTLSRSTIF